MVDLDRSRSVAHRAYEVPSFLFDLSCRFVHCVTFHFVFLKGSLTTFSYIFLHVWKSTVQTFSCIIFEIIGCHNGISILFILYVFRSYVSSTDDLYWAKYLGPLAKLIVGSFFIEDWRGTLFSSPVDCDRPFLKYVEGPTKLVVEVDGTKGSWPFNFLLLPRVYLGALAT